MWVSKFEKSAKLLHPTHQPFCIDSGHATNSGQVVFVESVVDKLEGKGTIFRGFLFADSREGTYLLGKSGEAGVVVAG